MDEIFNPTPAIQERLYNVMRQLVQELVAHNGAQPQKITAQFTVSFNAGVVAVEEVPVEPGKVKVNAAAST